MTFSIIVVCLNAGEKLHKTLDSILCQTEQDYEIIVKDGFSTDGSVDGITGEDRICFYQMKDTGIYDAMNQAVALAKGDYIFFLNCGDYFYDENVLAQVKAHISEHEGKPSIFYGNMEEALTGAFVPSNPHMDDFGCYRNVPCHQTCFYSRDLFGERGFDTGYRVRADYEHFLWCYYRAKATLHYMPVTVSLYEGGGFSETKENEKISAREHKQVVEQYMPPQLVRKYRWIMRLTFAGLRTAIARNKVTAKAYQKIKKMIYR